MPSFLWEKMVDGDGWVRVKGKFYNYRFYWIFMIYEMREDVEG